MVETLGEALNARWKITARCAWGKREGMKSIRACTASIALDLESLVWTRGAAFPVSGLATHLKCPRCGSRRVALLYDLPSQPMAARG